MPTTSTLRYQYPELITNWTRPTCDYSKCVKVKLLASSALGGTISLNVHPACGDAFKALASVFNAWRYEFRETAGGTVSCRKITGGTGTSLHAHGIALDINPSKNRYSRTGGLIQWGRQTDMAPEMIKAVEAIRTTNGKKLFEWGGRWTNIKDPMHFEIDVMKKDLATGINWDTVQGKPVEDEDMFCQKGDKGDKVTALQLLLISHGYGLPQFGADGDFGNETVNALTTFQLVGHIEEKDANGAAVVRTEVLRGDGCPSRPERRHRLERSARAARSAGTGWRRGRAGTGWTARTQRHLR